MAGQYPPRRAGGAIATPTGGAFVAGERALVGAP
jgi:hypothetical protein